MTRRPYWHGMFCADTRDEIAERMQGVLGDHYFTLVTASSYDEESDRFSAIDVYPSQWLTAPLRVSPRHLGWSTSRLSMGIHARAATQSEAREGRPHDYVHFTFNGDQIVIDHYAPAGYRLNWIFAVERHDREEAR